MAEKLVIDIEARNKKFNQNIDESISKSEKLKETLTGVATVSGAAFAGLTAGIGAAVNEAIKIEQINTQFEVLTGSVLGAEKAVKQLQDLSATTPFSFEEVASAGKQLLGFGFSTEELTDRLKELGNVAAASGSPVNDLSLIYGQVAAAGKLTGERLLQLQERAIPIGPAIAKTLGVAESAVRDLVSKGKVDFDTFQTAFASLSKEGGFAFGGLEKQSQTLGGQISTLKDNFKLILVEIGNRFLPVLKQVTASFIEFFQKLRNNPELIDTAVKILKIAAVTTGLITAVSTAVIVFLKLKAVLVATVGVLGAIGGFLSSPIVIIGALVAAVVGLVTAWDSNLSIMENITENFWLRIKTLFGGIKNIIASAFSFDIQGIKDGLEEAKAAFASSADEVQKKRDQLAEKQQQRRDAEVEAERNKTALLEQEEIEADQRKFQREEEKRQAVLEKKLAEAEEDAQIQREIDDIKINQGISLSKREQKLLKEDIKKKREQKDERDKKDLLKRIEQRKKEQEIETKFGTAYLNFSKIIDSERFKSAENLANKNIKLQQSSNATLRTIGKAAAVTQIGIDSFKGAMAVFAQSVATFPPPFGPALGAGLAAAQIAFGAEQIANVLKAQKGGMIEGVGRGDRIPALLEPGELVVPRQNFEDVIQAESTRRAIENGSITSNPTEIIIGFSDNAFDIIEEKILERRAIGVGLI